jgi:hypothetical protein
MAYSLLPLPATNSARPERDVNEDQSPGLRPREVLGHRRRRYLVLPGMFLASHLTSKLARYTLSFLQRLPLPWSRLL